MAIVDKITIQGRDILQFILDTVGHLRNLLVVRSVQNPDEILDMTADQIGLLKDQSGHFNDEIILYYIKQLSELENKIKYMSGERILLEVELLKLCHPDMDDSTEGLRHRVAHIEEEIANGLVVSNQQTSRPIDQLPSDHQKNSVEIQKPIINVDAVPEDIKEVIQNWRGVIERTENMTKAFLKDAKIMNLEDDVVYIFCENDIAKKHLSNVENLSKIEDVLTEAFSKNFTVKIIDNNDLNNITGESRSKEEGAEAAKSIYDQIKTKINFDIEIR